MDDLSTVIEKTVSDISDLKGPLKQVAGESEPMFISLGNELQNIYSDADGLTNLTRETARLIDGNSNDNILTNIGDFSKHSLEELNLCREDVKNILPNIEICLDNLKRLDSMCPIIKTIAKKLNIVALHISMESSRTRECEDMFNFFVLEIRDLASKVQGISTRIREDSERAKTGQISDFENLASQEDMLSSLADNARQKVGNNVIIIEDLIRIALEVMSRAETHSKKISSLVGDIVMAIQFQDIIRQQIEHVLETLDEIDTFFRDDEENHDETGEQHKNALWKAYMVLRIQADQLAQVINEINEARNNIKDSFMQIGNEVHELVSDVRELNMGNGSSRGENPFTLLISGLKQLNEIIVKGKEMAESIESNLKESAESASSLADHLAQMEDISMDLHIKAVNALIMSKRLGTEGKTLSVLAEDVTEVSLNSNTFVLDVVEILKSIRELATTISHDSSDESSDADAVSQISLSDGIEMIADIYREFISNSEDSARNSENLKDRILQLEPELGFLNTIENTLEEQLKNIRHIMDYLTPYLPEESEFNEDIAHITDRYTMEIERGVYSRAFNEEETSDEHPEAEYTGEDNIQEEASDDDLGDNIELF